MNPGVSWGPAAPAQVRGPGSGCHSARGVRPPQLCARFGGGHDAAGRHISPLAASESASVASTSPELPTTLPLPGFSSPRLTYLCWNSVPLPFIHFPVPTHPCSAGAGEEGHLCPDGPTIPPTLSGPRGAASQPRGHVLTTCSRLHRPTTPPHSSVGRAAAPTVQAISPIFKSRARLVFNGLESP